MIYNLGIVLYKPTNEIIKKVNAICSYSVWDKVFVYVNSKVDESSLIQSATILGECENHGLSKPYNCFINLSNNADYLCVMDQDSIFEEQEIMNIVSFINKSDNLQKVGIVAPRSFAAVSKDVQRGDRTSFAKYVINSGSFINLDFVRRNNLRYDEKIFLDGLDYDFCWQIRKVGGAIVIYENSVLLQDLGTTTSKRKCNHSPIRFFYMASSRRYTYQKFKGKIVGWIISFMKTISNVFKIVFYEDSKLAKIKHCFKGQFTKL